MTEREGDNQGDCAGEQKRGRTERESETGTKSERTQVGFTISVSLRPGLKSRVSTPILEPQPPRVPELTATIFQAVAPRGPSTASHPAKVSFPATGAEATVPSTVLRAERCHVSSAIEPFTSNRWPTKRKLTYGTKSRRRGRWATGRRWTAAAAV